MTKDSRSLTNIPLIGNQLNLACFTLFPLSVWQEIVFHVRQTCKQQTHFLKQNFSATVTAIDER